MSGVGMLASAGRGMSGKLFRRCFAAKPAAKVIADYESYEAIKTTGTKMMVGYFTASWSAASKLYESKFDDMAVVDVPTVAVMPMGPKPDGSLYDKTDLQVISAPLAEYGAVIPDAKTAIDGVQYGEGSFEALPWKFDPSTGTTLPPHQL